MNQVDLGKAVLKGVSRSFYLSVRMLPRLMREPVALGYLLARASDTLADTTEVWVEVREKSLELFLPAMRDEVARCELLEIVREQFIPFQENHKEQLLLERLEDVFLWYDSVREWAWNEIAAVMEKIIEGQRWDVRYFEKNRRKQVESTEDLARYCYLVAGAVGEFWTKVGGHAMSHFSAMKEPKLLELGAAYGKGLQLVNILRDLPQDLAKGRCYLPEVDPSNAKAVHAEARKYIKMARRGLLKGLAYADSLPKKRTRIATELPAKLGLRTLDMLEVATWEQWQEGIKISRKEVRASFWAALWS